MKNTLGWNLILLTALCAPPDLSPQANTTRAVPATAVELLGHSQEEVLAWFGAPADYLAGAAFTMARYPGVAGGTVELTFQDHVVVHVDPPGKPPLVGPPLPDRGWYLGQPAGEAVRRAGPARRIGHGEVGLELDYEQGTLRLAHGIVVGVPDAH